MFREEIDGEMLEGNDPRRMIPMAIIKPGDRVPLESPGSDP